MAVLCPKCSHNVDAEFGLATCPNCQSVLNIDFDGNVHMADAVEQLESVPEQTPSSEQNTEAPDSILEYTPEPPSPAAEIPAPETDQPLDLSSEVEFTPPSAPSAPAMTFQQPQNLPEVSAETKLSEPNFNDVVEFGNSVNLEGPLTYTLVLGNIDSQEIRLKIREILSEKSLQIDVDSILNDIHSGEVRIPNLGPAKTSRIVNKLLSLPISIRWRQNAY